LLWTWANLIVLPQVTYRNKVETEVDFATCPSTHFRERSTKICNCLAELPDHTPTGTFCASVGSTHAMMKTVNAARLVIAGDAIENMS
jgi:hypothetical protein